VRNHRCRQPSRAGSAGFTLVEVLVAVGLITLALGSVGSGIFQALSVERYWRQDVVATKELRHAQSWFAGDAINTATTSLVEDDPPASSVTLGWTDPDGVTHSATYAVYGSSLTRTFDGSQITMASHVTSASFSLSDRVLTFQLTVGAEQGTTDTASLSTYLRMMTD